MAPDRSVLRLGSRGSPLALWQAEAARDALAAAHPELASAGAVEIVPVRTTGDREQKRRLAEIGGKGLFTKELEDALADHRIDVAVHSMKDVPTIFPDELALRCITRREDPRDVLILRPGLKSWRDIPQEGRVGTSSLRRKSQLLHPRPDLHMLDIRGNVETRIRKLTDDNLDAVVLAAAGIKRLGFAENISEYLEPDVCLPSTLATTPVRSS